MGDAAPAALPALSLTVPARALALVEFPGYVRDAAAAVAALGGNEVRGREWWRREGAGGKQAPRPRNPARRRMPAPTSLLP
jgi:hypothetical protein